MADKPTVKMGLAVEYDKPSGKKAVDTLTAEQVRGFKKADYENKKIQLAQHREQLQKERVLLSARLDSLGKEEKAQKRVIREQMQAQTHGIKHAEQQMQRLGELQKHHGDFLAGAGLRRSEGGYGGFGGSFLPKTKREVGEASANIAKGFLASVSAAMGFAVAGSVSGYNRFGEFAQGTRANLGIEHFEDKLNTTQGNKKNPGIMETLGYGRQEAAQLQHMGYRAFGNPSAQGTLAAGANVTGMETGEVAQFFSHMRDIMGRGFSTDKAAKILYDINKGIDKFGFRQGEANKALGAIESINTQQLAVETNPKSGVGAGFLAATSNMGPGFIGQQGAQIFAQLFHGLRQPGGGEEGAALARRAVGYGIPGSTMSFEAAELARNDPKNIGKLIHRAKLEGGASGGMFALEKMTGIPLPKAKALIEKFGNGGLYEDIQKFSNQFEGAKGGVDALATEARARVKTNKSTADQLQFNAQQANLSIEAGRNVAEQFRRVEKSLTHMFNAMSEAVPKMAKGALGFARMLIKLGLPKEFENIIPPDEEEERQKAAKKVMKKSRITKKEEHVEAFSPSGGGAAINTFMNDPITTREELQQRLDIMNAVQKDPNTYTDEQEDMRQTLVQYQAQLSKLSAGYYPLPPGQVTPLSDQERQMQLAPATIRGSYNSNGVKVDVKSELTVTLPPPDPKGMAGGTNDAIPRQERAQPPQIPSGSDSQEWPEIDPLH